MLVLTLVAVAAIIIGACAIVWLSKHNNKIKILQERLNETATRKIVVADFEHLRGSITKIEDAHLIYIARIGDLTSGLQLLKSKFENFLEADKNSRELAKSMMSQLDDVDAAVEALRKQFAGFEEYRSKQSEFNLSHFDKVAALENKLFEVKDFLTKPSQQICELEKKIEELRCLCGIEEVDIAPDNPKRVRTKKLGDGKKKIRADVSTDNYV